MDQSDIYAMPSRWEGFSAAAVEAMGVGVACVFSDIEPFNVPYEDVALFHPVDDSEALADRLVTLTEEPELRFELASKGRELVKEQYTMESIANQYRDLYEEILTRGSPDPRAGPEPRRNRRRLMSQRLAEAVGGLTSVIRSR